MQLGCWPGQECVATLTCCEKQRGIIFSKSNYIRGLSLWIESVEGWSSLHPLKLSMLISPITIASLSSLVAFSQCWTKVHHRTSWDAAVREELSSWPMYCYSLYTLQTRILLFLGKPTSSQTVIHQVRPQLDHQWPVGVQKSNKIAIYLLL
jgi:hypothetical protein